MTESLLNTQSPPGVDPDKNYLEELVGEGKKFKTVEDLARGKYEADLHISLKNREFDTLSRDYAKLREDYSATPKLQEVLDKLLAERDSLGTTNTQVPPQNQDAFDPSKLDSLVESKFQEIETKRKADQNWNMVKDKLQEKLGDRFSEVLAAQTQKLGLTADKVDELARTSPSAFFRLMGLEENQQQSAFQSPPRTTQNATTFAPSTKSRKWSDWKSLQKTQPGLFSDPKAHNQMMADIKAIGEKAFYDI